jgi:hypothetical protein
LQIASFYSFKGGQAGSPIDHKVSGFEPYPTISSRPTARPAHQGRDIYPGTQSSRLNNINRALGVREDVGLVRASRLVALIVKALNALENRAR